MIRENINKGWKFFKGASSIDDLAAAESVAVNLPHTWNNLDGQDGGADYFRGTSYYSKLVDLNKKDDMDYYLEFGAVNSIAYVYVNHALVCKHEGGYSRFRCCITDYMQRGENTIVVAVDNSTSDHVYPQQADFTFFGGIYRDVYFIEVGRSRIDLDYYGSDGVSITPIVNKDGSASVSCVSHLTNANDRQGVEVDICFNGQIVKSTTVSALSPVADFLIDKPLLWHGVKSPNLYEANVRLVEDGEVLDSRCIKFGIRNFAVDKDGFYLNGEKYNLHGVSRHQDRLSKGWAIGKAEHDEDMALIREVGATSIRLAHYQHDSYFYDLCDENGMVVWAEIPYISVHMEGGDDNALSQMRELVIQNYNHPSIMFWGLSNEITIGGESKAQLELHKRLEALVKELDKTRLTTIACVTMCDTKSPLLDVPDIIAYNHYFGWYVGDVTMNAKWIDDFRANYPTRPLAISEYGAEGILSWHSSSPRRGDYSEEYQAFYHENMAKILSERSYLWATYVWNMFDFAADARDEGGVKGRNNKGLVTYDRKTKKDAFYLYKAYWSSEPFVHICSKRYNKRAEEVTNIKVYTNADKVDLYVGDKLMDSKTCSYVCTFSVNLSLLGTKIRVVAGGKEDEVTIRRVLKPCKAYTMPEEKPIDNWFMREGKKIEFDYPEGKFSVRDTFDDIYKTSEGRRVLNIMMSKAFAASGAEAQDTTKLIENMRGLMGPMSIERIAKFAGDKVTIEMLYEINTQLNKINKPN